MSRADHAHFINEARHYRSVGWPGMAAEKLALAAACRARFMNKNNAQPQQKAA